MIDVLYNVTLILEDPWEYAPRFRKSGYRAMLHGLDADEKQYGGNPSWLTHIRKVRKRLRFELRQLSISETDVLDFKANPSWQTLGKYLGNDSAAANDTPHKKYLRRFTFGNWREYSSLSHGAFEGLSQLGAFLNRDGHRQEDRPHLESLFPQIMGMHLGRAALLLLCLVTEIQLRIRYKEANVTSRLIEAWDGLAPLPEAEELFNEHYKGVFVARRWL